MKKVTADELARKKQIVEEQQTSLNELKGAKKEQLKLLKDGFGVSGTKALNKAIHKAGKSVQRLKDKFDNLKQQLEKDYEWD